MNERNSDSRNPEKRLHRFLNLLGVHFIVDLHLVQIHPDDWNPPNKFITLNMECACDRVCVSARRIRVSCVYWNMQKMLFPCFVIYISKNTFSPTHFTIANIMYSTGYWSKLNGKSAHRRFNRTNWSDWNDWNDPKRTEKEKKIWWWTKTSRITKPSHLKL